MADGRPAGAESSINKILWSELDCELHELALDLLGPDAELRRPVVEGMAVRAVGTDLRRHQRDPAQHRRRTSARTAAATMRFALTDDQQAIAAAVRDLLEKAVPDERATWDALVGMGVTAVLVAEADGGLGLDEVTMVAVLEQTGYAALAFPVDGDGDGGGAARPARRDGGGGTRSAPSSPTRSTPTS